MPSIQRVSPEEILHVAVCQAVALMNGSLVFAQSAEGQQVQNTLRTALTEYADAYMDQPVTEAERAAMIRGHAKPAAVPDGLPSDGPQPQHYVDGWNAARFAALGHPPAPAVDVEAVRADYERWIKSPPHEHTCDRHSDQSAWPGQYKRYETQLAWEAWQKARAIGDEK